MRIYATAISALLGMVAGAMVSLYLAVWLGGLYSHYEPGAYLGLGLAFIAVPIGSVAGGFIASVIAWHVTGRRHRPSA